MSKVKEAEGVELYYCNICCKNTEHALDENAHFICIEHLDLPESFVSRERSFCTKYINGLRIN